jgi:hypothetical protein
VSSDVVRCGPYLTTSAEGVRYGLAGLALQSSDRLIYV